MPRWIDFRNLAGPVLGQTGPVTFLKGRKVGAAYGVLGPLYSQGLLPQM